MMDSSYDAQEPNEARSAMTHPQSRGKLALALAAIAIAFTLVLAFVSVRATRRLESEVAQLRQQTQTLSQQVQRAQEQSQTLAQQASQAAASAQTAAQQRDLASQAQSNSETQALLARQQAAIEQQKASEAAQQAEQYRQEREAELGQLQQALGQIAQTRLTAMGLVMTLDNKSIRFDFDKSDIKPQYRDTLNRIAGILMTLKGYRINVYGYTDDVGTQAYNLQLSQRRAEAVRAFLVQAGISPTIMSAKGFGKSDPRVPGESDKARAANRRVEIGIVDVTILPNVVPAAPK